MITDLHDLTTEKRNPNSRNLDTLSTMDILKTINEEDQKVAQSVEAVLPEIGEAIDHIHKSLHKGGRLFYVGAGTSGRLGVLDASECPPTFMSSPEVVQTLMAGGNNAFVSAKENVEDDEQQGSSDLKSKHLTEHDVVVGITASGRTPYPIGALKYAKKVGAYTVALSCNNNSEIGKQADCNIEVVVGPEVVTGSTRMKAATAHKMILNMISTTTMIKLGKVYDNLMVDVHASNYKLRERAKRILMDITGVSYKEAEKYLKLANYEVKPAIVMIETKVTYEEAKTSIQNHDGNVREAIAASRNNGNNN